MFQYFRRQTPSNFIRLIDLKQDAVHVLEILKNRDRLLVTNYAIQPLATGCFDQWAIKNMDGVLEAIQTSCGRLDNLSHPVALAMPDCFIINKTIRIPAHLNQEECQAAIRLELAPHSPHPIEELSFDYAITGPCDDSSLTEVTVVACHEEPVRTRFQALAQIGFTVQFIDVASLARMRSLLKITNNLPHITHGDIILLLEVNQEVTAFFLVQNNRILFSKEEWVDCALGDFNEWLCACIDKLVVSCQENQQHKPAQIILSGKMAKLLALIEHIQARCHIPSAIANPIANMTFDKALPFVSLIEHASELMICTGMALR